MRAFYQDKIAGERCFVSDDDIQLRYILASVPQERNARILDAGCGNGKYSAMLCRRGYVNVFSVDVLNDVKEKGFRYITASIDALPFDDCCFDYVFANSVIYYLTNPEDGIKEARRVLKEDGKFFFSAHTKYSIFTLWRVAKRDLFRANIPHLAGMRFYSANYYNRLLKRNGFEVILRSGFNPIYRNVDSLCTAQGNGKCTVGKRTATSIRGNIDSFVDSILSEVSYHSVFVAGKVTSA